MSKESRISSSAAARRYTEGAHYGTTSAVDGVGKKVSSQGFSVRIIDPDLGPEGDLSNARLLAWLKRDLSRSKVLAAMLLPMASWRAASWRDSPIRHGEPGPSVATGQRN